MDRESEQVQGAYAITKMERHGGRYPQDNGTPRKAFPTKPLVGNALRGVPPGYRYGRRTSGRAKRRCPSPPVLLSLIYENPPIRGARLLVFSNIPQGSQGDIQMQKWIAGL